MATPKKVLLLGDPLQKEAVAASAITPGELLEWDASGDLQAHSTADGNAAKMFARENPFQNTVSGTAAIDTDYSAADTVMYYVCRRGDVVYAFLAAAENVSKGDALSSDGAGALQAVTAAAATSQAQRDGIVGYAAEAVDNSGGGSRVRIRVEIA